MSEKRKPKITFLLKWEAKGVIKRNRIELFDAQDFKDIYKYQYRKQFRMRVNGKWFSDRGKIYFYKTEIRDILWRSIPFY